jgi:molybdopterin-guanine dinucleotide biosynthesis protein A
MREYVFTEHALFEIRRRGLTQEVVRSVLVASGATIGIAAGEVRGVARFHEVEGFILAGGASSRMGRDKALLEFGVILLIVRAAQLLEPLVGPPTVVAPAGRYHSLGLRIVPDDQSGFGPLGAIATALRISASPWNLVVGCDLPYLTTEWLGFLIERAAASTADAVLPENERGLEPLCAMYHKRGEAAIRAALERGVRKITDGLAGLAVLTLPPPEWKGFDSEGRLFKNINTLADYEESRAASGKERVE